MLRFPAYATGVFLLFAAPAALLAQPTQHDRPGQGPQPGQHQGQVHQPDRRPPVTRPPARPGPAPADHRNPYGSWSNSWGAAPPAPPAHFTRHNDWYRHVRACQQRFRSYSPRTDSYRTYRGRMVRCTL